MLTIITDFETKTDTIEHGSRESALSDFRLMLSVAKASREVVSIDMIDNTARRVVKTWHR
jgi:hypothetical protein